MTQQDVYDWLKEHPGFYTAIEIAKSIGVNDNTVCKNLAKLRDRGDIERIPAERYNKYLYGVRK